MSKNAQPEELLTAADVAAEHGVDVRTVHRWVKAGRLRAAQKLPGLRGPYLFTRSDLEQMNAERTDAPALTRAP